MTAPIEVTELEDLAVENQRLADAEQAIAEIKGRRVERQRAADIKLLEEARNTLASRTAFYEKNLPVYRQQALDFENGRNHLLAARQAVDKSKRNQPTVAAYLPNDPECLRWGKNHGNLVARMAAAQAEFDAMPNPEALRQGLAIAAQQINTLTYTQANLVRKLEGWSGKSWLEGGSGVSAVGGNDVPNGKSWIRS